MTQKIGGAEFPICEGQQGWLANKFLSKIDAGDYSADKCWNWTGTKTQKGYGILSNGKRIQYRAHRLSMKLYLGREPSTMVLHKCDNPSCVNPMHLEEGTHGDNMKQMADRKRAAREERHHKAKLSFHEAVCIALLSASGDYTTRELAEMFSIAPATAIAAASGRNWPDAKCAADAMLKARDATS